MNATMEGILTEVAREESVKQLQHPPESYHTLCSPFACFGDKCFGDANDRYINVPRMLYLISLHHFPQKVDLDYSNS